jgi:hypothetical protein
MFASKTNTTAAPATRTTQHDRRDWHDPGRSVPGHAVERRVQHQVIPEIDVPSAQEPELLSVGRQRGPLFGPEDRHASPAPEIDVRILQDEARHRPDHEPEPRDEGQRREQPLPASRRRVDRHYRHTDHGQTDRQQARRLVRQSD